MDPVIGMPGCDAPAVTSGQPALECALTEADADTKIALPEEKKIYICRYGSGCTHINETEHTALFWHPSVPKLDKRTLRTHYICNECGQAFKVLQDLQRHLQRKSAWSNKSLIRSRVNVLIDGRSWHEGIVTSYRGGKHCIYFYILGEKRWFNMEKSLFYIIYQPHDSQVGAQVAGEVKEGDDSSLEEDDWLYIEDITLDYAFAQSVLFKVYGSVIQETGYKTRGHISLTEADRNHALNSKGSFLYGEFLPRGVNKALRENRLNAASARTLYDLGMGIGKVVMQAFLQFRNLIYVYGVELSHGRFRIAEEAVLRMVALLGTASFVVEHVPGKSIMVIERDSDATSSDAAVDSENTNNIISSFALPNIVHKKRVLHLVQGDLMDTHHIHCADILMLETDFPAEIHSDLCVLLSKMKPGSRTLTYLDLRKLFCELSPPLFNQLDINKSTTDRYPTSWSMQRGHRFYLWKKAAATNNDLIKKKSKSKSKKTVDNVRISPHSGVSSTDNGCVDFGISHQLDLSELAASDDPEDCGSASREKSGRISTFFSRVLSRFRRGNEMEGDRRVVPLRTCESNIDIPSRRHSRGHTETARGIVMDTFPLASTACAATEN